MYCTYVRVCIDVRMCVFYCHFLYLFTGNTPLHLAVILGHEGIIVCACEHSLRTHVVAGFHLLSMSILSVLCNLIVMYLRDTENSSLYQKFTIISYTFIVEH